MELLVLNTDESGGTVDIKCRLMQTADIGQSVAALLDLLHTSY